jgi:Flp pilus assembly protein CpaB
VQTTLTSRILGSRRATVVVGVGSAFLAAIVLIVYLNRYRESVNVGGQPLTVVVAKRLITKGTSAALIASQGYSDVLTIPRDQVKTGAVADPALLRGRVAVADIYPGQQITLADFSVTTTNAIPTRLVGNERALAIPLDSSHGMIGQVQAGDHVDLYVGLGGDSDALIKLLLADVPVLAAPGGGGGSGLGGEESQNFIFKVKSSAVPTLAFAADNATLRVVLRPSTGSSETKDRTANIQSLLKAGG